MVTSDEESLAPAAEVISESSTPYSLSPYPKGQGKATSEPSTPHPPSPYPKGQGKATSEPSTPQPVSPYPKGKGKGKYGLDPFGNGPPEPVTEQDLFGSSLKIWQETAGVLVDQRWQYWYRGERKYAFAHRVTPKTILVHWWHSEYCRNSSKGHGLITLTQNHGGHREKVYDGNQGTKRQLEILSQEAVLWKNDQEAILWTHVGSKGTEIEKRVCYGYLLLEEEKLTRQVRKQLPHSVQKEIREHEEMWKADRLWYQKAEEEKKLFKEKLKAELLEEMERASDDEARAHKVCEVFHKYTGELMEVFVPMNSKSDQKKSAHTAEDEAIEKMSESLGQGGTEGKALMDWATQSEGPGFEEQVREETESELCGEVLISGGGHVF